MARRTKAEVAADRELLGKISTSLETSTAAVERALLILFESQTPDEQASETTRDHNAVGFAANDATIGSRIVKNVILKAKSAGVPEGRRLWGSSLAIGRRITKRYAATQLLQIARERKRAQESKAS